MAFNTTPIGFAYADMQLNGSIMVNVPTLGAGGIGFDAGVDAQTALQFQGTFPTSSNLTYLTRANGTIPSGTTTTARIYGSEPSTQAASFTLTTLQHYHAAQGTLGAGSSVTTQVGFVANSTLTGATNNYGFQGSIAAGSNRYNCYMSGSADNYFAGSVGIGAVPAADQKFRLSGTYPASSNVSFAAIADGTVPSTATTAAIAFSSSVGTAAASFTCAQLQHFRVAQGTFGAGSSVTDQYGFLVQSGMTGATNNYGFYSDLAAASGRWNFYGAGTARNYFGGGVEVVAGTTTMASGFTHIPSAAGAPTGAPTNPSGNVPMYYDSTNHKIYVYSGGTWRSTAALT
jgi:hypothetical protein